MIISPERAYPIANGARPQEGPRALAIKFQIVGSEPATAQIDLNAYRMSCVQTIFIDNSANTVPVNISVAMTDQTITCLPQSQVFLPLLVSGPMLNISCAGAGTILVPCLLINIPMQPITYSAEPTSVVVSGVVPITGNVTAQCSQTTNPWVVAGNVNVSQTTNPWIISGNVNCSQTTSPWVISGTVNQGSPPWLIKGATSRRLEIAGAGPVQVVSGSGILWSISVLDAGASGVVYDAIGAGSRLAVIPATQAVIGFPGGMPFSTGLYVAPGAAQTVTVAYS